MILTSNYPHCISTKLVDSFNTGSYTRRNHTFCYFIITNLYHVIAVVIFVQLFSILMVNTSHVVKICVLTTCICMLYIHLYNKMFKSCVAIVYATLLHVHGIC